eukprot:CAMPEP_0178971032 /NCGR_PEP_ID=MMETSP0789-20121207/19991_1 /TAXON_ID=3005 /ORGANISM="Rhizosolenia setigera, Strain CCMP 1694" /LENGTH=76 /DNA_ID=CAMNT_0020657841 /DNA_START=122 /DNA_END=352 /DNA_ORIENTATION=+
MKPGEQLASQSSSNPGFGLCGLNVCFFEEIMERPRGTSSSPDDSASLSPHGHVEVVLAPGVVQGQGPKERLHGTHL